MRDDVHPGEIDPNGSVPEAATYPPANGLAAPAGLNFNLAWCLRAVRRYWPALISAVIAALIPAFFYLSFAKPRYSAVGEIIFDVREPKVTTSNPIIQSLNLDNYAIDSQVEIMRSYSVVSAAITRLDLDKGKLANGDDANWETMFPIVGALASADRPRAAAMVTQERFNTFLSGLFVERKGVSYVMQVSYMDPDPNTAARAVNTIMASYLSTQRRVKAETVQKAYEWLVMRTEELRQKLVEAELRLQKFKTEDAVIEARVMNTIYSNFMTRMKETQSQEMLQTPDARIVSIAVPPARPVSPKRGLVLAFSLAAGLSMGLALIFLQAAREPGVGDPADIARLTHMQPLAALPWLRDAKNWDASNNGSDDETAPGNPGTTMHRARRVGAHVLRTPADDYTQVLYALVQDLEDRKSIGTAQVVAVVSARDGDGKTTTALNLARCGATAGLKTLLIDADFHSAAGTLAVFDTIPHLTLNDCVNETAQAADCCIQDPLSPLSMCCAPSPKLSAKRSADVFNTLNFAKTVDEMRRTRDLIVIDTPAFFEHADARSILRHADSVIVIAKIHHTRKDELATLVGFCERRLPGRMGVVATNVASGAVSSGRKHFGILPSGPLSKALQSLRRAAPTAA